MRIGQKTKATADYAEDRGILLKAKVQSKCCRHEFAGIGTSALPGAEQAAYQGRFRRGQAAGEVTKRVGCGRLGV
jgi:hypothetical protein